jgi:hypothetical protein
MLVYKLTIRNKFVHWLASCFRAQAHLLVIMNATRVRIFLLLAIVNMLQSVAVVVVTIVIIPFWEEIIT